MIEPYKRPLEISDIFAEKKAVRGKVVAVLRLKMEDRGLQLILPKSRALRGGEVVEVICTTEETAGPGAEVNFVGYLGFVELDQGGMVLVGDQVTARKGRKERLLGSVVGFDETHMPNHLNIVIRSAERMSGEDIGLCLEQEITFSSPKENPQ